MFRKSIIGLLSAAACVLAASGTATAAPVIFDNQSLTWMWESFTFSNGFPTAGHHYELNLTLPPNQQRLSVADGDGPGANTFGLQSNVGIGPNGFQSDSLFTGGPARIATTTFTHPLAGQITAPKPLANGTIIGPGETFSSSPALRRKSTSQNYDVVTITSECVLGARFQIAGQDHYGFIHVKYLSNPPRWLPVRWGYESEPGVTMSTPSICTRDLNGDNTVNTLDLIALLNSYGFDVIPGTNGDLDSNGTVNLNDLTLLLSQFGCA